jgi:lipoprotein-anchoring transpeptidase ErfK/SrfK
LVLFASGQALAGDIGQSPAESSPRRIVVSIPDRKLVLLEDGEVRKVYDVAVGARVSPSPVGQFKIINRIVKPSYYGTGKVVLPGKNNPLGTRWLGLNKPSYGIHGTNAPKSIGKAASHGCIRMRNRDVEELFELVRPGDAVEILFEREEVVTQLFTTEPPEPIRSTPVAPQIAMAALAGEF